MLDAQLEKLIIELEEGLTQQQAEHLINHISRRMHVRIPYIVQTHKHSGTGDPRVPPETFVTKKDKIEITGCVISALATANFTFPAYANYRFHRMQFDEPHNGGFVSGWPKRYYDVVGAVRKYAKEFLKKR